MLICLPRCDRLAPKGGTSPEAGVCLERGSDAYLPIKKLALALNWSPEETVVVLQQAYFDESGDPPDPNVHGFAVAGCRASVEDWVKFHGPWKQCLDDHGVSWFHMTDFMQGGKAGGGEEFRDEKWGEPVLRERFLNHLLGIIEEHVVAHVGFGWPLLHDEFDAQFKRKLGRKTLYAMGHQMAITASLLGHSERVNFVFADHPAISHRALEARHRVIASIYPPDRVGSIAFDTPRRLTQLQAADLVAYVVREHVSGRGDDDMRRLYERLIRKETHFCYHFSM